MRVFLLCGFAFEARQMKAEGLDLGGREDLRGRGRLGAVAGAHQLHCRPSPAPGCARHGTGARWCPGSPAHDRTPPPAGRPALRPLVERLQAHPVIAQKPPQPDRLGAIARQLPLATRRPRLEFSVEYFPPR